MKFVFVSLHRDTTFNHDPAISFNLGRKLINGRHLLDRQPGSQVFSFLFLQCNSSKSIDCLRQQTQDDKVCLQKQSIGLRVKIVGNFNASKSLAGKKSCAVCLPNKNRQYFRNAASFHIFLPQRGLQSHRPRTAVLNCLVLVYYVTHKEKRIT